MKFLPTLYRVRVDEKGVVHHDDDECTFSLRLLGSVDPNRARQFLVGEWTQNGEVTLIPVQYRADDGTIVHLL